MRTLNSSTEAVSDHPGTEATSAVERPIKICAVFDEDASASKAEALIKHVASNFTCETQSFRFDELDQPAPGVAAALNASAIDVLVLSVGDDRMVPAHVQFWLGLLIGLRGKDQRGALVVLFSKAVETSGSGSSLLEYLAMVAAMGGLDFIPQQKSIACGPEAGHASSNHRKPSQSSLSFPARQDCLFGSWN